MIAYLSLEQFHLKQSSRMTMNYRRASNTICLLIHPFYWAFHLKAVSLLDKIWCLMPSNKETLRHIINTPVNFRSTQDGILIGPLVAFQKGSGQIWKPFGAHFRFSRVAPPKCQSSSWFVLWMKVIAFVYSSRGFSKFALIQRQNKYFRQLRVS